MKTASLSTSKSILWLCMLVACLAFAMSLASCGTGSRAVAPNRGVAAVDGVVSAPASYLPRAVIYKTNGDYDNLVAIQLAPDGRNVQSYPAPTDVTANSSALPVGNGWLLDRRGGIGPNTAFISMTYAEYAKLKSAPSPAELLRMVVPDAKVTYTRLLPITYSQALADPKAVEAYTR